MNKILIIISIIIVLYAYLYFLSPDDISIIQTDIELFEFDFLYKKQPIVIEDHITDIFSVIIPWFSPNIIKDFKINNTNTWNKNKYKYMFVYALQNTSVFLLPPKISIKNDIPENNETVIEIKLNKFQSVIIPFRWCYSLNNCKLYGIHDYITYVLEYFI